MEGLWKDVTGTNNMTVEGTSSVSASMHNFISTERSTLLPKTALFL